jgi:hypothetical protein
MPGRKKGDRFYNEAGEQIWPYAANLWKKGQSGNAKGTTAARRGQKAFREFMDKHGLSEELALVAWGVGLGRPEVYEIVDKFGKKHKRTPNLEWLKFLMEQMDGAMPRSLEVKATDVGGGIKSIRDFLNAPEPDDEAKES